MENKAILDVVIEDDAWLEAVDFDVLKVSEELKNLVFEHLFEEGTHELLANDSIYHVNVCLSNDEAVHKLNKEFRGIDKATNVLSFANVDDDEFWDSLSGMEEVELGDIILAFETLVREAEIKKISVYAHYCHLLIHGFLHLLGFDHQDDEEAEQMEALEVELLDEFSIANPYAD